MAYQNILVETRGRVGLLTLNRPKALNALNDQLMDELGEALLAFDADEASVRWSITGSEKAFAAGADIGAMKDWSYMDVFKSEYISRNWETIRRVRKPVIAAVGGLRAGRRLRTGNDVRHHHRGRHGEIWSARNQAGHHPGRRRHTAPAARGRQGQGDGPRALTARMMDAAEAERAGLVSRVVAADKLLDEALAVAAAIAGHSLPAVMMAKEAINRAYEAPLSEGMLFERRLFHSLFATKRSEGRHGCVRREASGAVPSHVDGGQRHCLQLSTCLGAPSAEP